MHKNGVYIRMATFFLLCVAVLGLMWTWNQTQAEESTEAAPKSPAPEMPKYTPKKPPAPSNNTGPSQSDSEEAVGEDSENGARWGSFGREPVSSKQEHQGRVPIYRRQ